MLPITGLRFASRRQTVRLMSFQDTLWLNGSAKRTYVRNSFVSGDTDFIFGDGVGVFDRSDIHYVTTHKTSGSITAPSHQPNQIFAFNPTDITDAQTRKNMLAVLMSARTTGSAITVDWDDAGAYCDSSGFPIPMYVGM
jgi:pectin methylesterase-like acyl-CoA thioesterase